MELNTNLIRFWWIGGLLSFIFISILITAYMHQDLVSISPISFFNWVDTLDSLNNLELLGQLIYTYYAHLLLISGLVLLVAMIGAIVLTLDTLI